MTEAPKRICAWSWKGQEGEAGQWVDYAVSDDPEYILATPEAIAASPEGQALIAAARLVKPLVWSINLDPGLDCEEVCSFGLYQITDENVLFSGHSSHGQEFDSPEAAKAAAQADYETRILAALERVSIGRSAVSPELLSEPATVSHQTSRRV